MARRNWNKVQATSLLNAIELCSEYGKEKHNLSVPRIAELMGLANHHILYKWMAEGKIPATMIRPFENACQTTFISRWISHSAGFLAIKIPAGRKATAKNINDLQRSLVEVATAIMEFHGGNFTQEECVSTLTAAMEDIAWHRLNIEKYDQPDLDLFKSTVELRREK